MGLGVRLVHMGSKPSKCFLFKPKPMCFRARRDYVACIMKDSEAPCVGCPHKKNGPLTLVHELVPWWLFYYYFMYSLDKIFFGWVCLR